MTKFYTRLRNYYTNVAAVLRGEANAASVFPNPTDIGTTRERIYAEFLRQHAPAKCNVQLGGFLFGFDGNESDQIDVLVTTDTAPRYEFTKSGGEIKSFAPVEGTLGVASIKSKLNKRQLEDALNGMAKIPPTASLKGRLGLGVTLRNYDDWPYKVIYASEGIDSKTLMNHLVGFYKRHPSIPVSRRPNLIHIAGKYAILRFDDTMDFLDRTTLLKDARPPIGSFCLVEKEPDITAIAWVLDALQQKSTEASYIRFSYHEMLNRVQRGW
jgi:hypothetical protein